MLGGGMRQAGILASAALYALEHHRERLARDHAHAAWLAGELAGAGVPIDPTTVETNIVVVHLPNGGAERVASKAARSSVLVGALDDRTLRLVTHLDVDEDGMRLAAQVLIEAFREPGFEKT
jgi:threonine aldolase